MADLDLHCNFIKCRQRLTQSAFVTRCSHAFCDEHGNNEFLKDGKNVIQRKCPACGMQLQKLHDIVKVDLDPSEEFKSMVLAGLRPDILTDILCRSLTFWNYQIYQQQIHQEACTKQARDSLAEVEKYFESVVHQIKNTLQHQEKKLKDREQELNAHTETIAKLKELLTAKTRQAQKTQQLYESLRRNTSASMVNTIVEPRINHHGNHSRHYYHHPNLNPPGFPFIQPQSTLHTKPTPLPHSPHQQNRCKANLFQGSASMLNTIEGHRINHPGNHSCHDYHHPKPNTPGLPLIQPQSTLHIKPLRTLRVTDTMPTRSPCRPNRCKANRFQGFNFKPVTPHMNSGQFSAKSNSKKSRVSQSQSRRSYNLNPVETEQ